VIYKALDASDWQGKVAHNSYVQLVAECGIPTLLLLVLIQVLPIYALWVRRRQFFGRELLFLAIAVVASTAVSFMWQSMLYYGEAALVWVALLLGVLMRSADPVTPQMEPEIGTSPDDIWSPPPA
jgi:O-antigen ligase